MSEFLENLEEMFFHVQYPLSILYYDKFIVNDRYS